MNWQVEVNIAGGTEPIAFRFKTKAAALGFARRAPEGIEVEQEGSSAIIIFPPYLIGRVIVHRMDA